MANGLSNDTIVNMAESYAYEAGVLQASLEIVRDQLRFMRRWAKRERESVIARIDETLTLAEKAEALRKAERHG